MPKPIVVSLDQIMSERQFSVKSTGSGDALTKIYKAPASWNAEARSARFVMTAEVVDRYGDVVVSKGADLTEFVRNPVALWAHNSRDFPIGMWDDIKTITGTPRRIEGTVTLTPAETTNNADTIAKLLEAGMVRACSIGFMPKKWESIKDDKDRFTGYKFLEWEMLECSVCSVPANPAAIVKAAGGDSHLALQAIELVLDEWALTPEGIIVPRKEFERVYSMTKDSEVTLHEVRSIDEDATDDAPLMTQLDISAAVSKGIADALSDKSLWDMVKGVFGAGKAEPVEVTPPAPVIEQSVEDEFGETEDEFQARIAAEKALEEAETAALADEEDERKLRERMAELA